MKHFRKIIIVVLLLVVFGGCFCYFLFDNFKSDNEIVGEWYVYDARRNNEPVDLQELYGTSVFKYGGALTLNSDNTYTEYIGVYSEEDIPDLEGTYEKRKNQIYLTSKSGKTKTLDLIIDNKKLKIRDKDGDIYLYFEKRIVSNESNEENSGTCNTVDNDIEYKYVGTWNDEENLNSIVIQDINNEFLSFSLGIFRVVTFEDLKATFVSDKKAEFDTSNTDMGENFSTIYGEIELNDSSIVVKIIKSDVPDITVGSKWIFNIM